LPVWRQQERRSSLSSRRLNDAPAALFPADSTRRAVVEERMTECVHADRRPDDDKPAVLYNDEIIVSKESQGGICSGSVSIFSSGRIGS